VLVLLKAPWVGITLDAAVAARPITSCRDVSAISNAAGQCEVLMTLPDGQTLCATLPQGRRWPGGRGGGDRIFQCRSHHSRHVMLTALTLRA
jgi:molybdate transport system regulatory protein